MDGRSSQDREGYAVQLQLLEQVHITRIEKLSATRMLPSGMQSLHA